jgi:hypothetical protein
MRLFLAACARQLWPLLRDDRSRRAVEAAEMATDAAPDAYITAANALADSAQYAVWDAENLSSRNPYAVRPNALWSASLFALAATEVNPAEYYLHNHLAMAFPPYPLQADLLREIVGSPFYYAPNDVKKPAWATTTRVQGLAHAAYDARVGDTGLLCLDRLSVLADALEDAGCPTTIPCPECGGTGRLDDDGDGDGWICPKVAPHPLLVHLRSPGPHVRGCHVIDYLLGLE